MSDPLELYEELRPDLTPDEHTAAREICHKLKEKHTKARLCIELIVSHLGAEIALYHCERAIEMHATNGGMVRADGKPRTVGGTYFQIIKNRLSRAQQKQVFPNLYPFRKKHRHRFAMHGMKGEARARYGKLLEKARALQEQAAAARADGSRAVAKSKENAASIIYRKLNELANE